MSNYIDPNSGAAPQPGGFAMPVVNIPASGMPVEAAGAPDQMDVGVLVEPKPKATRKPRAKKVTPDTSDTENAAENADVSDDSDEGSEGKDTLSETESADE